MARLSRVIEAWGVKLFVYAVLVFLAALPACNCDDNLGRLKATIEVQPPVLDFGSVPIDSTKQLDFTVRNKGSAALRLTMFEAGAPFIPPPGTSSVGTGRTTTLRAGFKPTALGPVEGTLLIFSDLEGAEPADIALTGIGIQAAIKVEPSSIDFGQIVLTPTTMPSKATITISNPGTDIFEVTGIELTENGAGQITLNPMEAIGPYAPTNMKSFEVTYTPSMRTAITGNVRIRSTAPRGAEINVPITARAVGAVIQLCGNADGEAEMCISGMDRPRVRLFAERTGMARGQIRAKNIGDSDLTITAVFVTGTAAEFSFVPAPSTNPLTIAPGGDLVWAVTYTPQDYAFDSVIVSFSSNSSTGGVESMRVEGDVIRPDLEACPRGMTFSHQGNIPRGQTHVKFFNCGTAPLSIGAITVMQTNGPVPAISLENVPPPGTTIPPQPACDCNDPTLMEGAGMDVVFATTTNGSYAGEVTVASSDPVEPTITISVAGTKSN